MTNRIRIVLNSELPSWMKFQFLLSPFSITEKISLHECVKSVRIRSFSGPYFPPFGLNTERYSVSFCIQSECGKIQIRKTPNTDTFRAVYNILLNYSYVKPSGILYIILSSKSRFPRTDVTVVMMMMMNCFCGMIDRRKACSLISSRDHCQRSSPSRISDTPQAGFEPAQNLS